MTIGITGASGFIGSHLMAACKALGQQARALHRDSCNPSGSEAMQGCKVVVHCAARAHVLTENAIDPLAVFRSSNRDLAVSAYLAAQAAGVQRFVFVSTVGVLGVRTNGEKFCDTTPLAPSEPYAQAKAEAEGALRSFAKGPGPQLTILRPPLVHGQGAKGNFARLLAAIAAHRTLPLGSARSNRRSLIGVENLCAAILTAAQLPEPVAGTFLVADDGVISTRRLIEILAEGLKVRLHLRSVPRSIVEPVAWLFGKGVTVRRLFTDLEIDDGGFRQATGWRPQISMEDGLKAMASHYAQSLR